MDTHTLIEAALEPVRREAMAAARTLGLPAENTAAAADAEWRFWDCTTGSPMDYTDKLPRGLACRAECLFALTDLLDPMRGSLANLGDGITEWIAEVERMREVLRRMLPQADRVGRPAEFAAWTAAHREHNQAAA